MSASKTIILTNSSRVTLSFGANSVFVLPFITPISLSVKIASVAQGTDAISEKPYFVSGIGVREGSTVSLSLPMITLSMLPPPPPPEPPAEPPDDGGATPFLFAAVSAACNSEILV